MVHEASQSSRSLFLARSIDDPWILFASNLMRKVGINAQTVDPATGIDLVALEEEKIFRSVLTDTETVDYYWKNFGLKLRRPDLIYSVPAFDTHQVHIGLRYMADHFLQRNYDEAYVLSVFSSPRKR